MPVGRWPRFAEVVLVVSAWPCLLDSSGPLISPASHDQCGAEGLRVGRKLEPPSKLHSSLTFGHLVCTYKRSPIPVVTVV